MEHQGHATGHGLGRFRLAASGRALEAGSLAPVPAEINGLLRVPAAERTETQRRNLALAILTERNAQSLAALPAPQLVYAVTRDFPPDGNFSPPQQMRVSCC